MKDTYPVQVGEEAVVKYTEEHVFVLREDSTTDGAGYIVRTANQTKTLGVEYVTRFHLKGELVHPKQRVINELEKQLFRMEQQSKYQKQYDSKHGDTAVPVGGVTPGGYGAN